MGRSPSGVDQDAHDIDEEDEAEMLERELRGDRIGRPNLMFSLNRVQSLSQHRRMPWIIMIEICKHRYNSNSHFMPFKFILSCELYYLFFCWLYDIIKIIVFIWNIPNILPVRLYGCISHCPHECVLAFINFLYLFC